MLFVILKVIILLIAILLLAIIILVAIILVAIILVLIAILRKFWLRIIGIINPCVNTILAAHILHH